MGTYQYVYTIYRARDDALLVFEQPARIAAEILGLDHHAIYKIVMRQRNGKYRSPKYRIVVTPVSELGEDDDDAEI